MRLHRTFNVAAVWAAILIASCNANAGVDCGRFLGGVFVTSKYEDGHLAERSETHLEDLSEAQFEQFKSSYISCLQHSRFPPSDADLQGKVKWLGFLRKEALESKASQEQAQKDLQAQQKEAAAEYWLFSMRTPYSTQRKLLSEEELAKARKIASDYPRLARQVNELVEAQASIQARLAKEAEEAKKRAEAEAEEKQLLQNLPASCNESMANFQQLKSRAGEGAIERLALLTQAGDTQEACKITKELESSVDNARLGHIECSRDLRSLSNAAGDKLADGFLAQAGSLYRLQSTLHSSVLQLHCP